jgi:hypothetical protein
MPQRPRQGQTQHFSHVWNEIGYSLQLALHEVRAKMSVAIDHFLVTAPDPLLDDDHRRSSHDQSAHSMMPKAVHTAALQAEFAKQW